MEQSKFIGMIMQEVWQFLPVVIFAAIMTAQVSETYIFRCNNRQSHNIPKKLKSKNKNVWTYWAKFHAYQVSTLGS